MRNQLVDIIAGVYFCLDHNMHPLLQDCAVRDGFGFSGLLVEINPECQVSIS